MSEDTPKHGMAEPDYEQENVEAFDREETQEVSR
ncbi:hypothetical protein ZOD2009_16828 [Haladaptatus paucihalophilus DX253]|uniref:Uncharacterized protein n=1 Tax=Haladaptatus paucihalophilus DX253 TaxID=797209 RepID=E7QX27_HALPU|nr:hypothetical protein ZOD2009_16828 [Haladaptatus paucihalophilus DX253]SHK23320.1 hypothetical protein SAMN05444342_1044 [Haladaptatus paucihalophilus DX253]